MVLIYIFGLLFLKNVLFPLVSFSRRKNGQVIFNQSPFIDLFNIVNTIFIFVLVFRSYLGSAWYDWIYFIFPLSYFVLEITLIIKCWNSEIRLDGDFIYIQDKKYKGNKYSFKNKTKEYSREILEAKKFPLKDCNFTFYKSWNNDDITDILRYKRLIRAYYLRIEVKNDAKNSEEQISSLINLNSFRLHFFFNRLIKELESKVSPEQINVQLNRFVKYHGMRWIYTILLGIVVYVYLV